MDFKFTSRKNKNNKPCEAIDLDALNAETSRIAMEADGWTTRPKIATYRPDYEATHISTAVKNHIKHINPPRIKRTIDNPNPDPKHRYLPPPKTPFVLRPFKSINNSIYNSALPDILVRSTAKPRPPPFQPQPIPIRYYPLGFTMSRPPPKPRMHVPGRRPNETQFIPVAPFRALAIINLKWKRYETLAQFAKEHQCEPKYVSAAIAKYNIHKEAFIAGETDFAYMAIRSKNKGQPRAIVRPIYPIPPLDDQWIQAKLDGNVIPGLRINRNGNLLHEANANNYIDRGRYRVGNLHAIVKINRPEINLCKSDVDILRIAFESFSLSSSSSSYNNNLPIVDWLHKDAFVAVDETSDEAVPQPTWKHFCDSQHDASTFQIVYKNAYDSIRPDSLPETKTNDIKQRARVYEVFLEQLRNTQRMPNEGIPDLLMIYLYLNPHPGGHARRKIKRKRKRGSLQSELEQEKEIEI